MPAPTEKPLWATQTQTDPLTGALNKVEPTEEFKLSGLLRKEFLSRAFLNYQLWLIGEWIEYLSGVVTVGELETDITSTNGKYQEITLTANTTLTESLSSGEEVILVITSGGFTITWPASVNFGDSGEPTLATKDVIKLYKVGTTVYAQLEWSET